MIAHGGSWIGYASALTIDVDAEVAVAVTCNRDGDDAESRAEQVLGVWSDT